MNNFTYAARYLFKSRSNNLTRVVSLTLGLVIGLVMFSYITYNLTFDRFLPDRERVYQMWLKWGDDTDGSIVAPIAPALKEEMPQIEAATRTAYRHGAAFYYGEEYVDGTIIPVDTSFFDVLDYGVVKGDPHEIFADPKSVMISESFAKRLFGDKDPIGEIVKQDNREPLTVAGIFRDIPLNTHLGPFDVLGSVEAIIKELNANWTDYDSFP